MTERTDWHRRSPEEAHLFNPAFCGALSFEFIKSYETATDTLGVDYPQLFCALPIALHSDTRKKLPLTTRTSVYTWLQRYPEVQVGFAGRARDLVPIVREGIIFAASRQVLSFTNKGQVTRDHEKASFVPNFLSSSTPEMKEIVLASRLLGRWFASAGATTTLLSSWSITV